MITKVKVVEDEEVLRVVDAVRTQNEEAADHLDATLDVNVRGKLEVMLMKFLGLVFFWKLNFLVVLILEFDQLSFLGLPLLLIGHSLTDDVLLGWLWFYFSIELLHVSQKL